MTFRHIILFRKKHRITFLKRRLQGSCQIYLVSIARIMRVWLQITKYYLSWYNEIWYDCLPNNKGGLGHTLQWSLEWSYVAIVVIRCIAPRVVKHSKCNKFKYNKNTSTCTWSWPHPITCARRYLTWSDYNFHLLVWLENCTLFITSTS